MTVWLIIVAWWVTGVGTYMWLRREDCPTWGEAVFVAGIMFGAFGPLVFLVVLFCIISQMDFWRQPICGRKDQ